MFLARVNLMKLSHWRNTAWLLWSCCGNMVLCGCKYCVTRTAVLKWSVFLTVIRHMGHCLWVWLTDYWATEGSVGNMTKQDRYFHICQFLSFLDSRVYVCSKDTNCERMWLIVLFKGRVVLGQCFPKEQKCFCIKIYKYSTLLDTYDIEVYLGKDWWCTEQQFTAAHAIVTDLRK
jgi:hypothetical protein